MAFIIFPAGVWRGLSPAVPALGPALGPDVGVIFARPGVRSTKQYTLCMTFRVVLDHDSETGDYSAVCPELPGCASAGETEEEARANIREAIELYLSLARRIRD
jgi:predicted RNase H-like HicB family nuclease